MQDMRDQQLLNNLDFIHDPGLGRGGYRIVHSPDSWQLYDDNNNILTGFTGHLVNVVGPFPKELEISSAVRSVDKEYQLLYRTKFWRKCTEQECIEKYLKPFFQMLRNFVNGTITDTDIRKQEGFRAYIIGVDSDTAEYFPLWIEQLKQGYRRGALSHI